MKAKKKVESTVDERLTALLAKTPKVSEHDLEELADAGRSLNRDAGFMADYLKGLFVEDVLRAMEEDGLSQSDLAARMGKSRQYLSKVLNLDRRVNFTVETMAEFGATLGRKVAMRLLAPSETMAMFQVLSGPETVSPMPKWGFCGTEQFHGLRDEEFVSGKSAPSMMEDNNEPIPVPA
ncbi:MAG: helix-turn-helix transcriptional regulator [Lentisphaerota bacterium]